MYRVRFEYECIVYFFLYEDNNKSDEKHACDINIIFVLYYTKYA